MMSIVGKAPVQDITRGQQALAEHLAKFLGQKTIDEVGWAQPDSLTLLVPLFGTTAKGDKDAYLLKLFFDHYPTWPPSALFVNPLTLQYRYPEDTQWLPATTGQQEVAFHKNYAEKSGQVVCCSFTLEFYKVSHGVSEELAWNGEKNTFLATISAIKRALAQPYYHGRAS